MEIGEPPRPTSRLLPVAGVTALALLAVWVMLGSYVSDDTDECVERYHAARTWADTLAVDSLVPERGAGSRSSCGFLRYAARWPSSESPQQDSMQVHAVATGIIAADNARDLITVLNYYADSAVLVPPGEEPVSGIDAIQKRYQALFASWVPAIEPRIDEIVVRGTTATVRGHNGGWLRTLAAGGADRALDDTYVMSLERRGGTWLIHRLQWSTNSR